MQATYHNRAGILIRDRTEARVGMNVKQAVPFFRVSNIEEAIRFYVEGLGGQIRDKWEPDGKLRWCWLTLGEAALMLQEFPSEGHDSWRPSGKVGEGVSIFFLCEDAVQFYREVRASGIDATEPIVGNGMWVTSLSDPDGYRLDFESDTDLAEGTRLSEVRE